LADFFSQKIHPTMRKMLIFTQFDSFISIWQIFFPKSPRVFSKKALGLFQILADFFSKKPAGFFQKSPRAFSDFGGFFFHKNCQTMRKC